MQKRYWMLAGVMVCCAVAAGMTLSSWAMGQGTKQLKGEPAVAASATGAATANEATAGEATAGEATAGAAAAPNATGPVATSRSYSVIIENRVGPDGKRVQTKKVWKDGNLVEDTENTTEPGAGAEPGLDLGEDIAITGDDGVEISGDEAGTILRSERSGGLPSGMAADPLEAMRNFEQEMLRQQQTQFERLRQLWAEQGLQGPMSLFQSAGTPVPGAVPTKLSEYWIGASVQSVPEQIAGYLGLEPGMGVLVTSVVPDSPAAKAGLDRRDIIVSLGDTEITDALQIGEILDQSAGASQKVTYWRRGKQETTELIPEKRPEPASLPIASGEGTAEEKGEAIRVVRPGIIVPKLDGPALVGEKSGSTGETAATAAPPVTEEAPVKAAATPSEPATPADDAGEPAAPGTPAP